MKKISFFLVSLACTSGVNAGTIGPVIASQTTPYVNLEASATWTTLGLPVVNGIETSKTTNVWGGRFSGGVVRSYGKVGLIGEVGGGYYGSTNRWNEAGYSSRRTFDGYDVLIGVLYRLETPFLNQLDIFGDVGFMGQNSRTSRDMDLGKLFQNNVTTSGFITGLSHVENNKTQILPEIKVGGIYNFNEQWGLTVSYLHVFGQSTNINTTMSSLPGNGATINAIMDIENPSFNSVLFGIRYYFA